MTKADVEIILQRARKKYPEAKPKIISDNGPQFIAKEFIRNLRHDARPNFAVLPAIERKNRTLAQIAQEIHTEHDRKLEAARQQRRSRRQKAAGKTKPPSLRTVRLTDEVDYFRISSVIRLHLNPQSFRTRGRAKQLAQSP